MTTIATIGHSNHPIERFLDLLAAGDVALLVDVRSVPYSRRFPQFGRERLTASLKSAGIGYLWEGEALGGKAGGYNEAATRPAFRDSLDRLQALGRTTPLCLMCAEKDPLACHRTVLVARRLAERGVAVRHFLADGIVQPHATIEETLLGTGTDDLFDNRDRRLARAWDARERAMKRSSA